MDLPYPRAARHSSDVGQSWGLSFNNVTEVWLWAFRIICISVRLYMQDT